MKNIIRKITRMTTTLFIIIGFTIGIIILFIGCSPQFGGKLSSIEKEKFNNSPNFKDGKFINKEGLEVSPKITFSGFIEALGSMFSRNSSELSTLPNGDVLVEQLNQSDITKTNDNTRLVWFGHSTFLIQLENKNILIDPMFGQTPSPFSWVGGKRFSSQLPIEIEKLPQIDAVLISHDHYDHLDYTSIIKLKDKVKMFYVPLGLSIHLEKWDIEKERIIELDWWDQSKQDQVIFRCTPAQHASGRKPNAMSNTLWSSWIINTENVNLFFSGDGGYANHFKEIGEKYGPFDFAMMECGQYNEMWPKLHMFPEQTVQASLDIKAKQFMPIHWGAFRLSNHEWDEPIERVQAAAKKENIPVIIPKIGEQIIIDSTISYSNENWWENY